MTPLTTNAAQHARLTETWVTNRHRAAPREVHP